MDIFYGHFVSAAMKAPKSISATQFKAHCLALLEEVRRTRQSLLVTRHGKPVAEISPFAPKAKAEENPLKGSILHQGDLISPLNERWDSAT
jgi:prevent-host-death family protein